MPTLSMPRLVTIAGLLLGAVGIAILWASGIAFPVYPPPGIIILLVGAIIVALVRRPWVPLVGAALGLFVLGGFLISPTGRSNLTGAAGTSVAIGQGVEVLGVAIALIAGLAATLAGRRRVAGPAER